MWHLRQHFAPLYQTSPVCHTRGCAKESNFLDKPGTLAQSKALEEEPLWAVSSRYSQQQRHLHRRKDLGRAPAHPWEPLSLERVFLKTDFTFPSCLKAFLGHWASYFLSLSLSDIPSSSCCHWLFTCLSSPPGRAPFGGTWPCPLLSLSCPEAGSILHAEEVGATFSGVLCPLPQWSSFSVPSLLPSAHSTDASQGHWLNHDLGKLWWATCEN